MKNIINYYYNFYPETISKMYGGFYFENNSMHYLFVELIVSPNEIIEIYEKLMNHNIKNYIIVNNRENQIITNHDKRNYILFVINCNANVILRFDEQIFIQYSKKINWSKLWSERIDYYEIQINELAQERKMILYSVNYYIGLAENAIAIASKYEKEVNDECAIQHYRMHVPVTKGDYFNPCNMLVDVSIRNVAEYIKSSFFLEKRDISYYLDYIKNIYLNDLTANLLLSRLMYPSYYFDLFDDIILEDRSEDDIIPIINFQKNYELFLKEVYYELAQRFKIVNINWLKKRTIIQH